MHEGCLGILPGTSLRIWGWILGSMDGHWILGVAPEVTQSWMLPLGKRVGASMFCAEDLGLVSPTWRDPWTSLKTREILFSEHGGLWMCRGEGKGWGRSLGGR